MLNGRYHVLGGTLSPLDGIGPEDLSIAKLIERAREPQVKEVLLALNATVEGQSTAHYLTDQLSGISVTVSRLAHGVPIGGELDSVGRGHTRRRGQGPQGDVARMLPPPARGRAGVGVSSKAFI